MGGPCCSRNWSWTQTYTAPQCLFLPPNNTLPFLLSLSANPRNMLFPCLKPAELQFPRIYLLIAEFWPTITLCSLCQSTYMSCKQRVGFSSSSLQLHHEVEEAGMGCTRFSLLCQEWRVPCPTKLLSQRKHHAQSTQPMAPPKPIGIILPAACGRIRAMKYRPCKVTH